MGSLSVDYCRVNQTGIDFLLTDLDLAITFMVLAEVSRNAATVRRNYENARTAHDTVVRLLERLTPNAKQRRAIDAKLAFLETGLQAVGYQL